MSIKLIRKYENGNSICLNECTGTIEILNSKGISINEHSYSNYREDDNGVIYVESNKLWGCIDNNGNELIPPKFDMINGFVDGVSIVKRKVYTGTVYDLSEETNDTKINFLKTIMGNKGLYHDFYPEFGIINLNGEEVVPFEKEH